MYDFFSPVRFYKYIKYQLIKNGRSSLSFISGTFLFLSFILFPSYIYFQQESRNLFYLAMIILHFFVLGILYNFYATKNISNKESVFQELNLPVSAFEKILYLLIKNTSFILTFPILYYCAVIASIEVSEVTNKIFMPDKKQSSEIFTFREYFNYLIYNKTKFEHFSVNRKGIIFFGYFLTLIITTIIPFRIKYQKHSLLKWFISNTLLVVLVLFVVNKFGDPFSSVIFIMSPAKIFLFFIFYVVLLWIFSYFLLKEKEVKDGF